MATPTEHAVCSASSSERWLHCTASPRYEENFAEETSSYAEEGRLAHSFCELKGRKRFTLMPLSEFTGALEALKINPLYDDEMLKTSDFYVQYLNEKYNEFPEKPYVTFEVQVDFSDYVPEGFGTCDNCMIGGHTLRITDYKHGKGVFVSSVNNSQMRLYALGALKYFGAIYGDAIKDVVMAIIQPRISEEVTEERMTVDELRQWGDSIKIKAQQAFTGMGAVFEPGEWCRFCRGKALCSARAQQNTAFEDFKNAALIPTAENRLHSEAFDGAKPLLTDEEVADMLVRAADLVAWYKDLQDYAQQAILGGRVIPGWKVVAGKSNRAFTDEKKVISVLTRKGHIKTADLYEPRKLKSLATFEKMLGKGPFDLLLGDLVIKPMGKPTLAPNSDNREPYNPAVADFAGVSPGAE